MRIGFSGLFDHMLTPCFDSMDTGGAGGSGGPVGGSGAGSSGQPGAGSGSGGSTAITLSDDSMIQPPGFNQPIKYSEWKSRYVDKADFTRTTQQYSTREKQYQAELARLRDAQSRGGQPGQPGAQQPNPLTARLNELASQPYIDGKAAVQIVTDLYQQAIGPLAEAIKQRDQALSLMFKKLQGVEQTAQGLSTRTTQGDFHSLLNTTKQSVGLPDSPVVNEFLQDIYLSHEGSDLNREFPNMVKARFEELAKVVREMDRKRAQDARSKAFGIPNRGGQATPGRPLTQGHKSPAERADMIWASLQGGDS